MSPEHQLVAPSRTLGKTAGVLHTRGISKTYPGEPPIEAVRGVDLDIPPGTITALIGPNGAGKSTLAGIVVGLIEPDAGELALGGTVITRPSDRDAFTIGYAPQEEALFPMLTVKENLRLFAELAGSTGADLAADLCRVAEAFLITDLMDRRPTELSGGQRRRAHNAIALLGHPQLVILDEPTAGVDPATRRAILDAVIATAQDGAAVCYSTHYLSEVAELDAHVSVLDHGRVIATGTVAELLAAHAIGRIEIVFESDIPELALDGFSTEVLDNRLIVMSQTPDADVGGLLLSMGDAVAAIRSLNVVSGDLDDVFAELTGRAFTEEPSA